LGLLPWGAGRGRRGRRSSGGVVMVMAIAVMTVVVWGRASSRAW